MRLSVFSPKASEQLFIDLKKLYQDYLPPEQITTQELQKLISSNDHKIFVTMFNERHLGALRVSINKQYAQLDLLTVRDLTRRRGIAKNLLVEVEKYLVNEGVTNVKVRLSSIKKEEVLGLGLFLQNSDYYLDEDMYIKAL